MTDYTHASDEYVKLLENYSAIYREYESVQQIINNYPTRYCTNWDGNNEKRK